MLATCQTVPPETDSFKPVLTLPASEDIEVRATPRNVFSVSYASPRFCGSQSVFQSSRDDMAEQEMAVKAYKAELHEAFIAKHEAAATLSPEQKQAALKMLVHEAAARDISLARREGYAAEIVAFMHQTWQTFLAQVDTFFVDKVEEGSDGVTTSQQQRNNSAVESISSIGIWFHGPMISLPLRRYTIQVVGSDDTPQLAVVVGLVSFCYSSYVMQTRAAAQQNTLLELARLHDELGTQFHFVPQLLLVPQ